jgi:hypothetical protein
MMKYKGRFTKTGNSRAFAFEASLFRSHPEFDSHNVEAEYIGPGLLLVQAVGVEDVAGPGEDPVLGAFLSFVERDMIENKASIQPLSSDLLSRAERLIGDMEVDLDKRLE